jgi:small subunit ribosomal protein S21
VIVNGSFDNAFQAFNRKLKKSGILEEYRKKEYFEKPSAKKRRLFLKAQRRRELDKIIKEREKNEKYKLPGKPKSKKEEHTY